MKEANITYEPREEFTPEEVQKWKLYDMHGYQYITCHVIFHLKMYFTHKDRFGANSSKTEAPLSLTYSSVVSRDSVRLAFLIAELND